MIDCLYYGIQLAVYIVRWVCMHSNCSLIPWPSHIPFFFYYLRVSQSKNRWWEGLGNEANSNYPGNIYLLHWLTYIAYLVPFMILDMLHLYVCVNHWKSISLRQSLRQWELVFRMVSRSAGRTPREIPRSFQYAARSATADLTSRRSSSPASSSTQMIAVTTWLYRNNNPT